MKYKSDILEAIYESATEKFQIGAISENRMREYDEMCLESETSQDNTHIRNIEHVDLVTA